MSHEVIVLGGGIAGSAVARRLALRGMRVALVAGTSVGGVEGMSERSVRLIQDHGAPLNAIPAARSGVWGARGIVGREWLIDRKELAQSLRKQAGNAGVELFDGWARRLARCQDLWRVATGTALLAAPWLIDARGRRGPALAGPKLLAVGFTVRIRATAEPATRIEPFSSGWCWWARRENELFVQITRRPRNAPLKNWLCDAANELPALAAVLETAEGAIRASARPAHARRASGDAEEALWQVGDRAWAPDPLSGQGVYEALRSAELIATALGSVMDGGEPDAARRFVAQRQAHAFERAVAIAADFYRENAERGPFWRDTAAQYAGLLEEAPEVAPHIESRPVLLDGRIVLRDVLVTRQHPRGVWQVGGVPIAPLFTQLQRSQAAHHAPEFQQPSALEQARRWLKQQVEPRNVTGPAFHEEFIRADS